ncbi:hypothetical protein RJ639_041677 [Escallonia herrerae]|uniref:CCHC-type domain-containing protein n=1 Tax=Escallonia herrerae TaxID=1293975 RepID=A0AA88WDJ3_9ASTE|nr:hypothetical protein RJ639_041677 [Escallonia herrerae]
MTGHTEEVCRKRKRTCFACGTQGHQMRDCPKNKGFVATTAGDASGTGISTGRRVNKPTIRARAFALGRDEVQGSPAVVGGYACVRVEEKKEKERDPRQPDHDAGEEKQRPGTKPLHRRICNPTTTQAKRKETQQWRRKRKKASAEHLLRPRNWKLPTQCRRDEKPTPGKTKTHSEMASSGRRRPKKFKPNG